MSLDQKVSALTSSLKSEFWKGWEETAEPAPWEAFTSVIPSDTLIQHYIQFGPVAGLSEWAGFRNYSKPDSFIYSLQNKIFQSGFMASLEMVEDDQTGGILSKPKELVTRAKKFPGRQVIKGLAAGASTLCFDNTNFFASSHNFGSGNNNMTYTATGSSDAATYKLAFLYYGDSYLKPLIWQQRNAPMFETNSGTPQSLESRQIRWWVDLRGVNGFGYWWNAVLVTITNTPSVGDMHEIFRQAEAKFRTFQLPKTISTDDGEYVHEQTEFNAGNLYLVGSTGIAEPMRQALTLDWVPQTIGSSTVATNNNFKGFAKYLVSAFMN